MPANVTPEYEKAEQRYREATTDAERVAALQDMLATIPKHKGTETALDQVEATFAALSARGLSLRTVPRNVLSFLEPSVRPGLIIANKADLADADTLQALRELYAPGLEVMAVSAQTGEGLTVNVDTYAECDDDPSTCSVCNRPSSSVWAYFHNRTLA